MRAYQIFAALDPEHSEAVLREVAKTAPSMFTQGVYAAAAAFRSRPQFVAKQPFGKRASMVRRALARVAANPVAEEMLSTYFLECRKEMLTDWLDAIGLEHEEGFLKENAPGEPDAEKLTRTVEQFRSQDESPDRLLLLQAFAAQSAIEWPKLDELIST